MKIPITGNVRVVFDVNDVEVETAAFSLETDADAFPVEYNWNATSPDGMRGAFIRGNLTVTKAQVEADAGKPFAQCTLPNIRRAIRAAVAAHVKSTL